MSKSTENINLYQEQIFYHYILNDKILLNTTRPEFFSNKNVSELFGIAKEHALKYSEPPSAEQLKEIVRVKGLETQIPDDTVNALYNSKKLLEQYEQEWLDDNIKPWISIRNLENVMRKSIAYMKTSKVTPQNASEVVEKVRHMLVSETALDFDFNLGSNFFDPEAHKQTRLSRSSTGFEFVDMCLKGGWWRGSLISLLADPKAGKSAWMQNMAAQSVELGYNTAYITLELQEELVNARIGSNMFNIHIDEYEEKTNDTAFMKKRIKSVKQDRLIPLGSLYVKEFPSSTLSATELVTHLKKVEEILGIKFDHVFIDYINIMKNWRNPNTENTYIKIKQISEDLRAGAQEGEWAFITATQTNRGGWENSDISISDIAESAALLHTVDGLFGIITDPIMKAEGRYLLKYLADRVSGMEGARKQFNVDWGHMRISEDKNSGIEYMNDYIHSLTGNNKSNKSNKFSKNIETTTPVLESTDEQQNNKVNITDVNQNRLFE